MGSLVLIGVVCVVGCIAWYIVCLNGLNRALVKIDEAESGIDVALQKRHDMLVKMLDVVKAYAKHENDVLVDVVKLRGGMSMQERSEASAAMDKSLHAINVVAEAYPQLMSSENYKTLQVAIADIEEHLQAARRVYNANVSDYNQRLVTFPSSLVASGAGMTRKEFFEAADSNREDVEMNFD